LLPVLVAELADDAARKLVEDLARERRVCLIPILDPPIDASLHVLEITTPGEQAPLVLLAEPAGLPTEKGFPLRLHPFGSPPHGAAMAAGEGPIPSVRATRTRPSTLSPKHTRDLLGEEQPSLREANLDAAALVDREIAGKLVIEELVGVGGMGAVYRARHKHLAKKVAVKVLHARFREDLGFCARFHAEALAISQLDHPNVVRILDYGQEPDGLLYLAMDFLSGIELQELLRREGTLPLPRIVDVGVQVSAGLGHAHARGIIHRDVKPTNIVLVRTDDDEGHTVDVAKVCDFGIAGTAGDSRDLLGTPAYMSPEQCDGSPVDGRSDVYALGVILYELATGQLPFNSSEPTKTINMQLNMPPPKPSSIRPIDMRLEEVILKALEKSPSDRPQSMRELRRMLRDLLRPPSLRLHDVGAGRAERDPAGSQEDITLPPQSAPRISSTSVQTVNPHALAEQLAREPVSTLRESLTSNERFASDARVIAAAMRVMIAQGELAALAHVVAIFRKVAVDPSSGVRAEISASLVRSLQDPALLAPIAEKALAEHDEAAPSLLSGLGLAAAHALYAARIRAHATPPVRGRFVAAMRALGAPSWPLLAAALQRNAPDNPQYDPRLAEDVLRSIPHVSDDAGGGLVAKYLRWGEAAVRRAAMAPLASLWGDRARALLLAVLVKDPDEGARVAAIRALRDLKAIDEHVVRKAEDMLAEGAVTSTAPAGDALKAAVAEALSEANDEARGAAAAALRRQLAPKGGVFGMLRSRAPVMAPPVLLSMARAYGILAPEDARKLIDELVKGCEDPLKTQLAGLLPR
jgi:eukaryotic-like serine/threonine-protein kinase